MRSLRGVGRLALAVIATAILAGSAFAANKVAKLEAPALAQSIDRQIQAKLDAEKVARALPSSDAEFLRRVYLDIVGVIPPAEKVVAFLEDKSPDKRAKVIDELLASPAYGRHMADIWQAMMLPRNSDNRRLQSEPLVKWLEENFNANKAWDKMTTEFLTATGGQDTNGATTFFIANPTADKVNDTITRLFLGVRLECAQCHNHPFTKWKQTDYWGMANFFAKVRADNPNRAAKQGVVAGVNEGGAGRQRGLPESALNTPPKFFLGDQPKLQAAEPYRPILAKWITSEENPYFARALVNRIWNQYFGRGIVNPVDDMHEGHPPTHPELLQELSAQFVASEFDVKHLIRAICNSQAYQRSSKPVTGEEDPALYAAMNVKVQTPEQLFDSLEQVLGKMNPRAAAKPQAAAARLNTPRALFVAFFTGDDNADPTEYQDGIPQALRLMNSGLMNTLQGVINQASQGGKSPDQVIEKLYLTTLSRRPTTAEVEKYTAYVKKQSNANQGYSDILWVLLNCSEFRLNH